MPYTTSWEANGIVWMFSGHVSAEEIQRANDEFYKDPRSDTAKYQLIDALNVDSVEWQEADIKEIAAMDAGAGQVIRNLKVAYVSNNKEISEKLEKYIEISRILNKSWSFRGFDRIAAALDWVLT